MKIVAAVYSHPEYYPPTLNAINQLAKKADSLSVLCRNVKQKEWNYPQNVNIKESGAFRNIREVEQSSFLWKIRSFIKFCIDFYKIITDQKPTWVICYDPFPLLAFRIVSIFVSKKPKLWYHNHDVLEAANVGNMSLGHLAILSEQRYFRHIDVFSLPANERKLSFPMEAFKGKYFFLPNYPSIDIVKDRKRDSFADKTSIILIFQGSIGLNHGYEEILLGMKKFEQHFNKKFTLVLKGFISPEFSTYISEYARQNDVEENLKIIGPGPYAEVLEIASRCDIGLAIHKGQDLMNKTLGTSSNKIYEYAAVGLPVLLFDNKHFKEHLGHREWTFFTDLTTTSLIESFSNIFQNYQEVSNSALQDFKNELNFEANFKPVSQYIFSNA